MTRTNYTGHSPMPGNILQTVTELNVYDGQSGRYDTEDPGAAQVITSQYREDGQFAGHRPVLDIDFPAKLIPSSTPGHFHLYLDTVIEHGTYMKLLEVLADAGIIEPGYAAASIERGYTAVRLPWVKKPEPLPEELAEQMAAAAVPGVPF